MNLLEITLIGIAVWVTFVTCILCLLKAAHVADESDDRERRPYPAEDGRAWRSSPAPAPHRRKVYGHRFGTSSARH